MVTTDTGETKGATEKEAETVLTAMVTNMNDYDEVGDDEEDDEDVQLMMGSLLGDFGTPAFIEADPDTLPSADSKSSGAQGGGGGGAERKTSPGQGWAATSICVDAGRSTTVPGVDEESMDSQEDFGGYLMPGEEAPPSPPAELNAQALFLQQVACGSAFKSSAGKTV